MEAKKQEEVASIHMQRYLNKSMSRVHIAKLDGECMVNQVGLASFVLLFFGVGVLFRRRRSHQSWLSTARMLLDRSKQRADAYACTRGRDVWICETSAQVLMFGRASSDQLQQQALGNQARLTPQYLALMHSRNILKHTKVSGVSVEFSCFREVLMLLIHRATTPPQAFIGANVPGAIVEEPAPAPTPQTASACAAYRQVQDQAPPGSDE